MSAYVFAQVTSVSDPARFTQYQGEAEPTVTKYGGKFLAGGTKIETADGDWKPIGVMCAEFENLAKAKEWYNSAEYQAAIGGRLQSTVSSAIFVDAS